MSKQEDIIRVEIESILDDIKALYNASGKRTTGQFEEGLEAKYTPNGASIYGYTYLAGRAAGKMPPVTAIQKWIEAKGITPLKGTTTSLAWAIAKTIAKSGTKQENHLKIYDEVITPERINEIINKVSVFNVNLFVNEINVELKKLVKNI